MSSHATNKRAIPSIGASILAGDFAHLAEEAKRLADAGADSIHIDVMDGHFVRNLTMGPQIVAAINRSTELFLDVHLMIYDPFDYIERFVEAGADRITIHLEATEEVSETLGYIRRCNIEAGLALCPETSESLLVKYLDQCDLLLLMTVPPGFGGQPFMPEVLEKVQFARSVCDRLSISCQTRGCQPLAAPLESHPMAIQVDGGIDQKTARLCLEAGADHLVSGSYLFGCPSLREGIESLRHPS